MNISNVGQVFFDDVDKYLVGGLGSGHRSSTPTATIRHARHRSALIQFALEGITVRISSS